VRAARSRCRNGCGRGSSRIGPRYAPTLVGILYEIKALALRESKPHPVLERKPLISQSNAAAGTALAPFSASFIGPEERMNNGHRAKDGQASSGRVVRQGIDRKEDLE
jgi:hypothetical protein